MNQAKTEGQNIQKGSYIQRQLLLILILREILNISPRQ